MSETSEDLIIRIVRESGRVCDDPDFQPGFALPNQKFDSLRSLLLEHDDHGQPYFRVGRYYIIREEPRSLVKSLGEIHKQLLGESVVVQPA